MKPLALIYWCCLPALHLFAAPTLEDVAPHQTTTHWAFQAIRNAPAPEVKHTAWPQTAIDPFILAQLEARRVQPAHPADKRALIRRATFDLIGLPPTPEEIDAFLDDHSPAAFAKVVDRLLNSPHYGEHWGRHWLDVVRYADTAGETADYPAPEAWRYRNYVIDAFNADKPYDEFVREQIAGDILAQRGPRERYAERVTATGFLAISRRFGFDSENYHHLTIQDTLDTLGQAVLGLSLGCARCHDHKYDPITTTDYYALYGIFESSRYAFPGSEQKQKVRALAPLLPPDESFARWREFDERVAALKQKLERNKLPVPPTVLRSLDDLDGDFELQAVASGGSKGVLVPPWSYQGNISVTKEAQSPFKNVYRGGNAGVSLSAGTNSIRLAQALHPARTRESGRRLHCNLDFRVSTPTNSLSGDGSYRIWLGHQNHDQTPASTPALELFVSKDSLFVRNGEAVDSVRSFKPGQWQNLQLVIDLHARAVSGRVGWPGDMTTFSDKSLSPEWDGTIDFFAIDTRGHSDGPRPMLELDNWAVQESPSAPVDSAAPMPSAAGDPDQPASHDQSQASAGSKADAEKAKDELARILANGPCEMAYGVVEGTPVNARIQIRGEPDKLGPEVPRGFIKALRGGPLPPAVVGSGRLELGQWLTRPDYPLTARVMVNRIWQYHFGRGLVKTPNDFGARGAPPTHPELLDCLAAKFIESGWSIKAMHRLIMLSATYQQSSASAASDPSADLYSGFLRRRLDAEAVRDAILAVSGALDPTPGRGHPFPSPTGWGFTQHRPFSAVYDHDKRSVFLMNQRLKRHPFLALFDGADPNASTPERRVTTVPTQALFFLNDSFIHAKAEKFAARLVRARADAAQRMDLAYHLAFGRPPSATERRSALEFLDAYRSELVAAKKEDVESAALAAYARVLFSSNEFIHTD